MAHGGVARELENVEMPDEVGADVAARILHRVANARLCPEVDDAIERCSRQCGVERAVIGEIDFDEVEPCACLGP